MTEQGERRINQPQCDPTGGKNAALPPAGGGGGEARVTGAGLHHELARALDCTLGFSIACNTSASVRTSPGSRGATKGRLKGRPPHVLLGTLEWQLIHIKTQSILLIHNYGDSVSVYFLLMCSNNGVATVVFTSVTFYCNIFRSAFLREDQPLKNSPRDPPQQPEQQMV